MNSTSLRRFRTVSYLEGASFLLLLLVAMPLKYLAGMPMAVKVTGSAHGLLFVLYMVALLEVGIRHRWGLRKLSVGFVASFLPLGPFAFHRFADKLDGTPSQGVGVPEEAPRAA